MVNNIKIECYKVDAPGIRAIMWLNLCRYCVFQSLDLDNHLILYGALEVVQDFALREHIRQNAVNAWEFQEIIDLCRSTQQAIVERVKSGDWQKYKW